MPSLERIAHLARSGQTGENLLDGVEVGQVLGSGSLLGVADHAFLIDHKSGTCAGGTKPEEVVEEHTIVTGGGFIEIAGYFEADFFLGCPSFLGEGAIDTDGDDISIQVGISTQTGGDVTHFLGANAGESEWEEQEYGVFGTLVVAELDFGNAFGVFGLQAEVGSLGAYFDGHEYFRC